MRLAVVTLGFVCVCASQPAWARAQSTGASATTLSIEETRQPHGSRTIRERLTAQRVLVGGIGTLVGVLLVNGAISAIASLAMYLEGTRVPCLEGLCGYEALFATPFVPLVGSALWSGLILESPPRDREWVATFGLLAMVGQQVGLSMILDGASDLARPIDWGVSGFVSNEGAWLMTRGIF